MPQLPRVCPRCSEIVRGRCPCTPRPQRPSAARRGYGSRWHRIRAAVLADEPDCRQCGAPAEHVDHIVPKRDGGTDARINLRPLCQICHNARSGRQAHRGARW